MDIDAYFAKWRHFISTILHVRCTMDTYLLCQATEMDKCPQKMSCVDFEDPTTPELFDCSCENKECCEHRVAFMKFHNSCMAYCVDTRSEFYVFILHEDMSVKCFTVEFYT